MGGVVCARARVWRGACTRVVDMYLQTKGGLFFIKCILVMIPMIYSSHEIAFGFELVELTGVCAVQVLHKFLDADNVARNGAQLLRLVVRDVTAKLPT